MSCNSCGKDSSQINLVYGACGKYWCYNCYSNRQQCICSTSYNFRSHSTPGQHLDVNKWKDQCNFCQHCSTRVSDKSLLYRCSTCSYVFSIKCYPNKTPPCGHGGTGLQLDPDFVARKVPDKTKLAPLESCGEDDSLTQDYIDNINSVLHTVGELDFDFNLIEFDFDWMAFRYIRIELSKTDVLSNLYELRAFLDARGYEFFNERAIKSVLTTVEKYFNKVRQLTEDLVVAQREFQKWSVIFKNANQPFPFLAEAGKLVFEYAKNVQKSNEEDEVANSDEKEGGGKKK